MPTENDEFIDQELEDGEFMELADIMQPLEEQHMQEKLPEMDMNSELTLSVGLNEVEMGNLFEAMN